MQLFYNLLIAVYYFLIKIFALFDYKAKLWINGRKNQILPDLTDKKVIWMHCSSLGEFEQGRPIFEKLKEKSQDCTFVLTFFSPSGYERLKDSNIAHYILYLPIDLPSKVKVFIDKINPEISIFVKYDFWYNYLSELNKRGKKVFFISVLLTKKHRLFGSLNTFILNELKKVTKIFTQTHETTDILNIHGFNNTEIAGDTRIDRVLQLANSDFKDKKLENFISTDKKIMICGSTWEKDIDILSSTQDIIFEKYQLIIAPHEISSKQIKYIKLKFTNQKILKYSDSLNNDFYNILIIDTIGILSRIYRYAHIAYVGGGFGEGIHNTLEPASYTIPVIFGPKFNKFHEASVLVKKKSFFAIGNVSSLIEILLSLNSEEFYLHSQNGIKEFLNKNRNASNKIISQIMQISHEKKN